MFAVFHIIKKKKVSPGKKKRPASLPAYRQNTVSSTIYSSFQALWGAGRGHIQCAIVCCWCCDHDSRPSACWSCSCFFRLLSSSTRLCTARFRQSASGSPSATSVDIIKDYWQLEQWQQQAARQPNLSVITKSKCFFFFFLCLCLHIILTSSLHNKNPMWEENMCPLRDVTQFCVTRYNANLHLSSKG